MNDESSKEELMIKLTPEHVGGRVLLSDGEVGFVASHDKRANEHTIKGDGFYFGAEQDDERITLLLDAPNPLDVPVPEWCRWVIGWRVFDAAPPHVISAIHGAADFPHDVFGWSPAPGQLPPREGV